MSEQEVPLVEALRIMAQECRVKRDGETAIPALGDLLDEAAIRIAELEADLSDAVHALNAALSRGDRHGHRVAELEAERDRWKATADKLFREILDRCNDNGGEIDRGLVAEIKAALGEDHAAPR